MRANACSWPHNGTMNGISSKTRSCSGTRPILICESASRPDGNSSRRTWLPISTQRLNQKPSAAPQNRCRRCASKSPAGSLHRIYRSSGLAPWKCSMASTRTYRPTTTSRPQRRPRNGARMLKPGWTPQSSTRYRRQQASTNYSSQSMRSRKKRDKSD